LEVGADAAGKRLQAYLAARVNLRFDDTKAGLDTTQVWEALYGPLDGGLDLDRATEVDYDDRDLRAEPPSDTASFRASRSTKPRSSAMRPGRSSAA